jgi:hypothetical protein
VRRGERVGAPVRQGGGGKRRRPWAPTDDNAARRRRSRREPDCSFAGRSKADLVTAIDNENRDSIDHVERVMSYVVESSLVDVSQDPIRNVSALLLYTDGFYRLVEPLGLVASPSQLVGLTRRLGAVEAMNLLRKHEGNVPSRKRGSAFGSPDDATALYAAPTPSQL